MMGMKLTLMDKIPPNFEDKNIFLLLKYSDFFGILRKYELKM